VPLDLGSVLLGQLLLLTKTRFWYQKRDRQRMAELRHHHRTLPRRNDSALTVQLTPQASAMGRLVSFRFVTRVRLKAPSSGSVWVDTGVLVWGGVHVWGYFWHMFYIVYRYCWLVWWGTWLPRSGVAYEDLINHLHIIMVWRPHSRQEESLWV
jgi:hypothetical protein